MSYDERPSGQPYCRARFSDGETAGNRPVQLTLTDRGLEIRDTVSDGLDRAQPLLWPYGALTAEPPLARGATSAVIGYNYQPSASLWIDDADFLNALRESAPRISAGSQRRRWLMPIAAALVAIGVTYATISALNLGPARTLAGLVPESWRIAAGRSVANSLQETHKPCVEPAGQAALDAMVERLVAQDPDLPKIEVSVIDWNIVNALTAPGGRILLTRGLIETAKRPAEVAGVLAHEIGHAKALHPEAGLIRTIGIVATLELLVGGGAGSLASFGGTLLNLGYARDAEREADATALKLLRKSEISHRGLQDFFERVGGKSQTSAAVLNLLRTHPAPAERLQKIIAIPDYPSRAALRPRQWGTLKQICSKIESG